MSLQRPSWERCSKQGVTPCYLEATKPNKASWSLWSELWQHSDAAHLAKLSQSTFCRPRFSRSRLDKSGAVCTPQTKNTSGVTGNRTLRTEKQFSERRPTTKRFNFCSFSCFYVKYLELLVKLNEPGHSRAAVVTLCGCPASPALMLKDIFSEKPESSRERKKLQTLETWKFKG